MMRRYSERRIVLLAMAAVAVLIVIVAALAPTPQEDERPTSFNTGPGGAKAAYLLLGRLGYSVARWERPAADLSTLDAAHTTLVLAEPFGEGVAADRAGIDHFLARGGRIVVTGAEGATLLPKSDLRFDVTPLPLPCRTKPEGFSPLARTGTLTMSTAVLWRQDNPAVEVAQHCANGAAVVSYAIGAGEVVWWSDAAPLTNRGMHNDANLRLLLASVDPDGSQTERGKPRQILFDEYLHDYHDLLWRTASGTPLHALELQLALAATLLVLSFSRRHGPLRALATAPRTSPLEFAHSMGNLYHRAGAGEAAIAEARRRLFGVLERQCGLSRETLRGTSAGITTALRERFGYHSDELTALLDATLDLDRTPPAKALPLVQQLDRTADELRHVAGQPSQMRRANTQPMQIQSTQTAASRTHTPEIAARA
jgi:hypothetical protein